MMRADKGAPMTKRCLLGVFTAFVIVGVGATAGVSGQDKAAGAAGAAGVRAAIEAGNKKFSDGAAKKDAALIAAAYTPDGEAFPPNADIVKGRPALQKMWQSVLDSGITGIELATTEVESSGNIAYESGTYTMKTKDGKVADRGKYCVVWKRVANQWLLHRDIWSTSLPEARK
jgi:ketosteroid isomerase-like protein